MLPAALTVIILLVVLVVVFVWGWQKSLLLDEALLTLVQHGRDIDDLKKRTGL